ncbi:MAG: hypothetical protein ACRDI2_23065 [Chloroflexota bacterium]
MLGREVRATRAYRRGASWASWEWSCGPGPGCAADAAEAVQYRHDHLARGHHGPFLPLFPFAVVFLIVAFGSGLALIGALLLAGLLAVLVINVAMLGRFVAGPSSTATLPDHVVPPARPRDRLSAAVVPGSRTSGRITPGGPLAGAGGQNLYRQRLLDVLKDRYVRGEITLAEFETRAGQIARDPSARHLA